MISSNDIKPYLPIKEAAKYTGISEYQIRQWIKTGKCPYIECGKKYVINVNGLLEHLEFECQRNMRQEG